MKDMGIDVSSIRVGNDNLFQSEPFSNTIATLMNSEIHVIETNGAAGSARGAGIGLGYFSLHNAFDTLKELRTYVPQPEKYDTYKNVYERWLHQLNRLLDS